MTPTTIAWATLGLEYGESINPIRATNKATGKKGHFCAKIGPGCATCYASSWQIKPRNQALGIGTGLEYTKANRPKVDLVWDNKHALRPFRTSRPTGFFPCDMTDWLGWDWNLPRAWSYRVLAACAIAPWNRYFLLTKRYEYLAELVESDYNLEVSHGVDDLGMFDKDLSRDKAVGGFLYPHPRLLQANLALGKYDIFTARNLWLGVSICNQQDADKARPYLERIRNAFESRDINPVIGVSYEPCLGPVNWSDIINLIDWIIPGGESDQYVRGKLVKGRPSELDWYDDALDVADAYDVPVFVKQTGSHLAKKLGLKGKGDDPTAWPDWMQVRNFPNV